MTAATNRSGRILANECYHNIGPKVRVVKHPSGLKANGLKTLPAVGLSPGGAFSKMGLAENLGRCLGMIGRGVSNFATSQVWRDFRGDFFASRSPRKSFRRPIGGDGSLSSSNEDGGEGVWYRGAPAVTSTFFTNEIPLCSFCQSRDARQTLGVLWRNAGVEHCTPGPGCGVRTPQQPPLQRRTSWHVPRTGRRTRRKGARCRSPSR